MRRRAEKGARRRGGGELVEFGEMYSGVGFDPEGIELPFAANGGVV